MEYTHKYKKLQDENKKFIALQKIYEKFLGKEATHPLNTRDEYIRNIEKIIEEKSEIPEDVFEKIIHEVKLMIQDTFSRFKESKEFKQCLEEL